MKIALSFVAVGTAITLVACGAPAANVQAPAATVLTTPRPVAPQQAAIPTIAPPTPLPTAPSVVRANPTAAATALQNAVTPTVAATRVPAPVPVTSEMPGSIDIPAINLSAPIRKIGLVPAKGGGVEWGLPSGKLVGWHDDSAKLGEGGNIVLSGHHNIEGLVFQRLNELPGNVQQVCGKDPRTAGKGIKQGQTIVLRTQQREVTYELADCKLLLQRGMPLQVLLEHGALMLQDGEDKLTIVTCWPFTDNSHRLVLIAKPVSSRIL